MKKLKNPVKNPYTLVQDLLDGRIMPDEAFVQGIQFNCKFIGSMDISRPTSRVEIVAAMRRVRFEYKQKGIKKKKVTITIGIDGIKTTLRKQKRSRKRRIIAAATQKYKDVNESNMLLLSHPIYRIFYVSHDSQDVKIFSYIARETSSNTFHCCVFKATKKAQAMRIVRTVGQAFEVCHNKFVDTSEESPKVIEPIRLTSSTLKKVELPSPTAAVEDHEEHKSIDLLSDEVITTTDSKSDKSGDVEDERCSKFEEPPPPQSPHHHQILHSSIHQQHQQQQIQLQHQQHKKFHQELQQLSGSSKECNKLMELQQQQRPFVDNLDSLINLHETKLLQEKLEQQQQQTQAALAQVTLLRDQLQAETNARIEAQGRTHQLLLHNKELLDHLHSLVKHIQELEGNHLTQLPQLTPRSKIERWFKLSDGDAIMPELPDEFSYDVQHRSSKRTLVSSGFVSQEFNYKSFFNGKGWKLKKSSSRKNKK